MQLSMPQRIVCQMQRRARGIAAHTEVPSSGSVARSSRKPAQFILRWKHFFFEEDFVWDFDN